MTQALYIIIIVLLGIITYLWRELKQYKKRDDYYISVDEENARLREAK